MVQVHPSLSFFPFDVPLLNDVDVPVRMLVEVEYVILALILGFCIGFGFAVELMKRGH